MKFYQTRSVWNSALTCQLAEKNLCKKMKKKTHRVNHFLKNQNSKSRFEKVWSGFWVGQSLNISEIGQLWFGSIETDLLIRNNWFIVRQNLSKVP